MSLLVLVSSPTRTGRAAVVTGLAKGLAREGISCRLFHDTFRHGDLSRWCIEAGIETDTRLTLSTLAPPHLHLLDVRRLVAVLRADRPRAILATETHDLILAAFARKLSAWSGRLLAYAPTAPRPALRGLADAWIVPGDRAPEDWDPAKISCLPTGPLVDTDAFAPPLPAARRAARRDFGFSDSQRVIGWVGRFKPGRGVDELLVSFLDAASQNPEWRLLLVGFGETLPLARWWVQRAGLSGRICFAGFRRDDLARCYQAMDLLLLPVPGRDGLGRAALEALACGCPVRVGRHPVWTGWINPVLGIDVVESSGKAWLEGLPGDAVEWEALSQRAQSGCEWVRTQADGGVWRLVEFLGT